MAELQEILIANLTLDTYRKNNIPPLVVPKGDYGARVIRVKIMEQGEAVTVKERDAVYIVAERSGDGASEAFSGKVNKDGSVTVPVTQWMLEIPVYDVICHVVVTGNGYQYSTNSFLIEPQSKENPTELSEDDPRKNVVDELLAKENENYDAVKNTFSNAIKGNVSGKIVSMDDVSPVEHKMHVELRSKNVLPYPYEAGSNVVSSGLTFTSQSDGGVKANGTSTGKAYYGLATFNEGTLPVGKYSIRAEPTNAVRVLVESYRSGSWYKTLLQGDGVIDVDWNEYTSIKVLLYVYTGSTLSNVTIYPMMNKGTVALSYSKYVSEGTLVTTKILGNNPPQDETTVSMKVAEVKEISSIAPNMTISTDNDGVIVEAQYNKDANKVIEKLTQAIISLGGNV